jgi:hypothetical protein
MGHGKTLWIAVNWRFETQRERINRSRFAAEGQRREELTGS